MYPDSFKKLYITVPKAIDISLNIESSLHYIDFATHQLEYISRAEKAHLTYTALYTQFEPMQNNFKKNGNIQEYSVINIETYLELKKNSNKILVKQRTELDNFLAYIKNLPNTYNTYTRYDVILKKMSGDYSIT